AGEPGSGNTVETTQEAGGTPALRSPKLVFQIGNKRRFDPGIVFAQKFIQEEIGALLAFKAWYWDSIYRYTMTDNLQPIPMTRAAARKPKNGRRAHKRLYF